MKAIVLISGGLDSILAAGVIKGQGVEVIPLNFKIPFCHRSKRSAQEEGAAAVLVRDVLGVDLLSVDISGDYLELLKKPRYGFGANMNPCIDCKILMLKKARGLMDALGASFLVTGEVLGQRPMSQHRRALEAIEKDSGTAGLLLRPLSAKFMPETLPEKNGWVRRDELLDFSGRGRSRQFELAAKLGIKDFAWPGGGCLLTDPQFAKRLKELMRRGELKLPDIELLKLGRHFRISDKTKLVVGRNEEENILLEKLAKEGDHLFYPNEITAGPTSLGRGDFDEEMILLASRITCRYCDLQGASGTEIICRKVRAGSAGAALDLRLNVEPLEEEKAQGLHI
jgi:tRNA U34 2-thiouridine synthase MnmA/TrmU